MYITAPEGGMRSLPGGGVAFGPWMFNAITGKGIRDLIVLAINVADCPVTVECGKLFAQVVAFLQKFADVGAVTAPRSSHHLDH